MKFAIVLLSVLGLLVCVSANQDPKSDLQSFKDVLVEMGYPLVWRPTQVEGVPTYKYERGDEKCHRLMGHCGTTCTGGATRGQRCGGGSERVCCVPDVGKVFPPHTNERQCADKMGVCGHGVCAGGAVMRNLCPGTARCCINGLPGTQYSRIEVAERTQTSTYGPYRDGYRWGPQAEDGGVLNPNQTPTPQYGPLRSGYAWGNDNNNARTGLSASWISAATGGAGAAGAAVAEGMRRQLHNSNTNNLAPAAPKEWLTQAGRWPVEKLDRSGRRSFVQFTAPANKFLLHTIEGRWPTPGDYEGGTGTLDRKQYWPHFILARDRSGQLKIGQYLPLNVAGRALAAHNKEGAIQVEIGAKAGQPFTAHDQDLTDATAALWCALTKATNGAIPLTVDSRVRFTQNGAYGKNAKQRLSVSDFKAVAGLVGHQHAPANSHWDPGAIDPQILKTKAEEVCRS